MGLRSSEVPWGSPSQGTSRFWECPWLSCTHGKASGLGKVEEGVGDFREDPWHLWMVPYAFS